jgi:hypothetical protein
MKPPTREVHPQLLVRKLQPADKEYNRHASVKDAVFGSDDSAMGGNVYSMRHRSAYVVQDQMGFMTITRKEICQQTTQAKTDDKPLCKDDVQDLLRSGETSIQSGTVELL